MRDRGRSGIFAFVAVLTLIVTGCGGASDSASTAVEDASTVGLVDIGAGLQGPQGTTASEYASGLTNVSAFAFDAWGRLWAGTAAFSPDGSDGVYLVSQARGTPVQVIDDVSTVLGLLWYADELYVAYHERVAAYGSFDGARFATARTVVAFPEGIGEVNGIAIAADGRMSAGISAPCNACDPVSEYSAAVVSFRPDGSDLRVDATGIRAPIGLAFWPGTNDLLVSMNQRDDLGDLTPGDWLAVVRPGQDWRFPACYGQGGSVCAGVPAPIAELDKHAAVSGIAIVTDELGPALHNSVFVAEWKTGVVLRVAIEPTGNGYVGEALPFLEGLSNPVPVALGPEGALYVGDWSTGTVYRVQAT